MNTQAKLLVSELNPGHDEGANFPLPLSDIQDRALIELEQRLLGWQLKGEVGVLLVVARELRAGASTFHVPYNRVQAAIFKAEDGQRSVSVMGIASDLQGYPALEESGGWEHLQDLAFASPAIISHADGEAQALATIRAWRHLQVALPKVGDVELIRADSVNPTKIDWVWPGWLAAGKFHLIAGSPGTGKTTLSLALAASITSAGRFPCGALSPTGSVLMWTGEDDLADSIIPRFLACGGNRSRLHMVSGVREENGEKRPFDPAHDFDQLVIAVRQIKDLKLLIIDPVVSAVTGDSHKNSETRRGLQPLVDFAANAGVAVLGVTHYSKGTAGRDPAERVTGSLAFVAVPRLVMVTAKPKEDGESWRLVRAKSNIGPDGGGFEYDLCQVPIDETSGLYGQGVVWGDVLAGTAQTLLAEIEAPDEGRAAPALESAKAWLQIFLGTGTVSARAIEEAARQKGHSLATIRRAKGALGVEKVKQGFDGGWAWRMPKTLTVSEDGQHERGERLGAFEDAHQSGVDTFDNLERLRGDHDVDYATQV